MNTMKIINALCLLLGLFCLLNMSKALKIKMAVVKIIVLSSRKNVHRYSAKP